MDDREMGRRIGYWRRRRKLTQAVFADRLGRSKSWVEKVERGERSADRLSVLDAICGILQIDISALIGQEPARSAAACIDDSEVEHIRSALERYPLGQEAAEGPDMLAVRRRLDHVWAAFEFGDYQVMGAALPGLLRDAQRSHAAVGSEESARLLAEVYQVIASTLRKLGEYALAWLAGDRGISVAQQAGDLASVAAAGFRVANALLSMGRPGRALDLNMSLADQLQPECQTEELRALYGHVVLQAAMAGAALGDQGRASELITEARDVARFVTPGSNHYRLAFEPVNVTLHEVGALVVLGENGRAVEVADAIGSEGLRMLRKERRAALLVDTARACSQAGNRDEALRRLLVAEEVAAPEVRCRPVAQATIADLLHRCVGMPPLALMSTPGRAVRSPPMSKRVLYVIACGAPPACEVGQLVRLAQDDGWEVCVLASPMGRRFADIPGLEEATGYPVRTEYKNPGEPDVLPPPDAIIVAPATVNTINKWAAGICDTLPLGILVEAIGKRLPIVAMPFTNRAHAAHPAFMENIAKLRSWDVTVLFGPEVYPLHDPGTGSSYLDLFPWAQAAKAINVRALEAPTREP